jgi:bifunctional non-homologous end joining protein LigD
VIPHPEKVLFPRDGISREELARYYARVALDMLPHLAERALTVRRWPHGIDEHSFYQKHPMATGGRVDPAGVIQVTSWEELLTWVGLGVIEFHAPLHCIGRGHDWAVIDLDPNPPAGWEAVRTVARVTAAMLDRLEARYLMKTSGAYGVHFYLPIQPMEARRVTQLMEIVARLVVAAVPEHATIVRRVALRGPRVYVDYLQNGPHRTMAAVYTVRARDLAPVSYPTSLEEVCRVQPEHFTIRSLRGTLLRPWRWDPPNPLEELFRRAGLADVDAARRTLPVERVREVGPRA